MPSAGERYRARHDAPVMIWVGRGEAALAQLEGVVPAGEVLIIEEGVHDSDLIFAQPERYAELEEWLVPLEYRDSPYYGGYGVVVDPPVLAGDFELISPAT
jgi:hypothetical protein